MPQRLLNWAKRYIERREAETHAGGRKSPDFTIGNHQLDRWWIYRNRRIGGIYLHRFNDSDEARALHDHPWWSLGLILGPGGYWEVLRSGRSRWRGPGTLTFRRPTFAHRVVLPTRSPVYTLFFVGPEVREWGFLCPQGWRPWKQFVEQTEDGNRIGRGCE